MLPSPRAPRSPRAHDLPEVVLTAPNSHYGSLTIGPFERAHLDRLAAGASDPETRRWLPLPRPYTLTDAARWALGAVPDSRRRGVGLARAISADGVLLGVLDAKRFDWWARSCEISYWLCPDARRQHVASSALRRFTDWLLLTERSGGLGLGRVELRIAEGNGPSRWTAEAAGYEHEGTSRRAGYTHDGPVDLMVFSRISTGQ